MKAININIKATEADLDELSASDRKLAEAALRATENSYAPYSRFSVGAAILLSNGEIVEGSNQENAAFPSGMCAERTACYYAHSRFPHAKFEAIAIAARDSEGNVADISPCGACRQALAQYEMLAEKPVKAILVGKHKALIVRSISELLPLAFTSFK